MIDALFIEIAAVIISAGLVALFAALLRQPLIIAYLFTGLIVGPSILGFTDSAHVFEALAEIGIAFLLFLVGINLNWRSVKDVGIVSVVGGLGQVFFTSFFGCLIALLLGFSLVESVFLGIAFAFSSTIIIVKLLSDKQDLDRFYGRISVGALIVQDIIAMAMLLFVGASRGEGGIESILTLTAIKLVAVLFGLWILARFILPHLFRYAARSQELLFLTALAWCFSLASLLHLLGFGIEIGALLAGISLSGMEFHREIESKVRPLRDFFLILFFIYLGTTLSIESLQASLVPGLIFSAFILFGNPLIFLFVLRALGYHPRTGFLVGLTMAQISEFSFIFLAAAAVAGFVDESILPLTTIVALITIGVSTYFIMYGEQLYERLEFLFRPLEIGAEPKERKAGRVADVMLFGYHRIGTRVLPALKQMKMSYMVVDIDPAAVREMEAAGVPHIYGDAGNAETLEAIGVHRAKIVISTIPDEAISMDVVEFMRKHKRSRATVIVTVKTAEQAGDLYAAGANFVIVPSILGGEHFAELLKKKKFSKSSWTAVAKKQIDGFGA